MAENGYYPTPRITQMNTVSTNGFIKIVNPDGTVAEALPDGAKYIVLTVPTSQQAKQRWPNPLRAVVVEANKLEFKMANGDKVTKSTPCNDSIMDLCNIGPTEYIHPQYRSLLGKLGWIAMSTRPDICFTYSILSRFANCGGVEHYKAALHCLKYLAKTAKYSIRYEKKASLETLEHVSAHSDYPAERGDITPTLVAFTDSSHGGERPMAGHVLLYGGGPVGYRAKRVPQTTLSVCETEYVAATLFGQVVSALGR